MNLPNYKYRATALSGKMVRGTMMASDPEALLNELKKKDLFLLDYSQTNRTSFGAKLKPKELTDFCRQLGSLLEAAFLSFSPLISLPIVPAALRWPKRFSVKFLRI